MALSLISEAASSDPYRDDLNGLRLLKKDHELNDPGVVREIQKFIRTHTGVVAYEKRYAKLWVTNVYASVSGKKVHEKLGMNMKNRIL